MAMNDIEQDLVRVLHDHPLFNADPAFLDSVRARIGRQRKIRRSAAAAAAALVVAIGAAVIGTRHSPHPPTPRVVHRHLNPVSARFAVGQVSAMTVLGADLWAFNHRDDLIKIDMRTNKLLLRSHISGLSSRALPSLLLSGQRKLWLAANSPAGTGRILTIDPASGRVIARLDLGGTCNPLNSATLVPTVAFGAGYLWAICHPASGGRYVARIDPRTDRVDARTPVMPMGGVEYIAAGPGGAWISSDSTKIMKVDPSGTRLRRVAVRDAAFPFTLSGAQLAVSRGALWALTDDETLVKIDPTTGRIIRFFTYRAFDPNYTFSANRLVIGFGSIWLEGGSLLRVSATTGRVQARMSGVPYPVVVGGNAVWVGMSHGIVRVDPYRFPG
jgi:hypothetical protein